MTPSKQILIVEDNEINREILAAILSEHYAVLEAKNGREALDILQQHPDDVALILLDVMMPVMDGYTFLSLLKEDERLSLIPVIVMTQSSSEEDEVAALAHGATDFVPKPYRPQVILHRVASLIKLRETAAMVNLFQYDRLTGLYSKEFFCQKVRECLRENPEQEYTIVCSNIENFKLYNDVFGVKSGDRLLCDIAEAARMRIGNTGFCGRFGADRFLYLQEREREIRDRRIILKNSVSVNPTFDKNIQIKWGIYEITDRSLSVEKMCDRAFLAADSIKGQYDRILAVYDDAVRNALLREQAITECMESALLGEQFSVYLQPKYCLHNDSLAGAEALVRWIHPEWGFMSPGEFIPLFEKNGFITRLDHYIWEKVCQTLRDWKERGYPALAVSVNVSRVDIYQESLVEDLVNLVRRYEIRPEQLHLELTESAYTENPSQIISTVDRLRSHGFIIEMDDFGSGYSSLNMLNQMKLDVLKLDMKFIQSETVKPSEQGILKFIVNLARWMNLSVVAEGVETRAQLERLRDVGCDYVQGYFFARPMPIPDFEALLEKQRFQAEPPKLAEAHKPVLPNVLVVDEDVIFQDRVKEAFAGQCRILRALSAEEALDFIKESEKTPIDAVVLSMILPERGAARVLDVLRQDPSLWRVPVLSTMPDGESFNEIMMELDTDDFLCKHHPINDLRRRVNHMLTISDFRERERLLRDEASRDYLTGLLNRRGMDAAVRTLRHEDMPAAVYLFDLDDLKKVNDLSGHDLGDTMLCSFSNLLRSFTRDGDILCRYGGDEFLVILRRMGNRDNVLKKGESICKAFRDSMISEGIHPACSVGIVMCGADEKPSQKIIERADQALYRAKRENKGGCVLWEEEPTPV